MKKTFVVILMAVIALSLAGQEKEKKEKAGWKFGGALPATTYDSNLGFQYGALVEFFNYGDPSVYPDFLDHTYTEVSRFTKGSGIYRMMYESNHLIGKTYLCVDLSYLPDKAYDFYGFNGYESVFNKSWMKDLDDGLYKTRMFYRLERNQFRIKADLQGKISGEHLKWGAGFAFQNFSVGSVDIDRFNKGKDPADQIPQVTEEPGLYEIYRDSLGIISTNEADGGRVNTLKAAVVWDSRDNRPNPMKGIWSELGVEIAPSFMGNDRSFSKFYITHRQYFTLKEDDLSFVYRLGYQTTLSGTVPFFYQSQVITSRLTGETSEGLGGSSTLRGVLRNRVVGDGFLLGNVELRWKPVYFRFLKQDCYLGINAFYDFGIITDKIELPDNLETRFDNNLKNYYFDDFFNPGSESLHQCAGISILPVMNQNFVIAIDLGKSFNKQDGNIGFSFGLNYLF
ncbi:MAG TPA: BamA/TamA family outer membrane protein [Bacteroidales bacterium]|nr:BamA/TamA family outer membrane protein [Bacteroidales bacterium]HQK68653.1 BamA/TamA family outer membrane protein [Bacteroidales bacterium]